MRKTCLTWVCIGSLLSLGFDDQHADYPVIVVGSGYGGSVAAYNLARAGISTVVLERGRSWTVEDPTRDATFATLPSSLEGDGRAAWLSEVCVGSIYQALAPQQSFPCPVTTGVFETLAETPNAHDLSPKLRIEGTRVVVGAGVGGGSLVSNGVSITPLKVAWDAAFSPDELPHMQQVWSELTEGNYFGRALEILAPAPIPKDILNTPEYESTRWMRDSAISAGYPEQDGTPATSQHGHALPPIAVDWNAVRDELSGQRVPSITIGESALGNNSGAKRSLDKPDNYLGLALRTGHVEVKPLHSVTRVTFDPRTKLYTVEVAHTDLDYHPLEQLSLTTRHLILAAGSIGTTKLLVRARDARDLPRLNRHVGTRWSTNGNSAAFGFMSQGVIHQGGPAGIELVNADDAHNPVVLETLPQRVPAFFADDPMLAPFLGSVFTIGLGIPTATGSFRYDAAADEVVLSWPRDAGARVHAQLASMLSELGGMPLILEQALSQAVTAHPLGGVPLGLATDLDCQLRGYDGLYAVDGSLIPGAAAATNPSVLVTALAQRCMDRITARISRSQ